jgi:hypothetical protein
MVFEFLDEIHDALFLFGSVAGLAVTLDQVTLDQYVASVFPIAKFENVMPQYEHWEIGTARRMIKHPYAALVTGLWVPLR